MAHDAPPQPLRDKRDIRDYDPNIIRLEFNRMLYVNKVRKRSKQLKLWKVITLASYYQKLMASSRAEHMRQAVNYTRQLDAITNQTDSVIETKQQQAINNIANQFSDSIGLINSMNDNLEEYQSLMEKCQKFGLNVMAFAKLARIQRDKVMVPVRREYWSAEDLKTLPFVIDEVNKVITNLNDLRVICKLIAPTNLPKEKDIAELIQQAQKLCHILEVDNTITESQISIIS